MKEFITIHGTVLWMWWNPLRHIKDMQVRHLVLQLLAWM